MSWVSNGESVLKIWNEERIITINIFQLSHQLFFKNQSLAKKLQKVKPLNFCVMFRALQSPLLSGPRAMNS